MGTREQLEHLAAKVDEWKKEKERQAKKYRQRAFAVRLASAILGALVTIFLGVHVDTPNDQLLKNLALVSGALIAVVNAIESFSRDRALWLGRQMTLLKLYDLEDQIEFVKKGLGESDNISREKINKLFEDYRKIWQSASREWEDLYQEELKESQGDIPGRSAG
ncbi:MAG: DUF4231 domain-containing protein [Anaerolineales bacterium]|nr:DUF4231 domain-containing protein [Anaerolineales bacterium]